MSLITTTIAIGAPIAGNEWKALAGLSIPAVGILLCINRILTARRQGDRRYLLCHFPELAWIACALFIIAFVILHVAKSWLARGTSP